MERVEISRLTENNGSVLKWQLKTVKVDINTAVLLPTLNLDYRRLSTDRAYSKVSHTSQWATVSLSWGGADKRLSSTLVRQRKTKRWSTAEKLRGCQGCWNQQLNRPSAASLNAGCSGLAYVMPHLLRMLLEAQAKSSVSSRPTQVIQLKLLATQTHLIGLVLKHSQHGAGIPRCPHGRLN